MMKKVFNKSMIAVVAAAMVAMGITACGGTKEETTAAETTVAETTAEETTVEESTEAEESSEGTVIKRQNGGARETFTVRKNSNGIGVEKTWPVHSPFVDNIEVVRRGKVRRAKLNYLRDRVGKAAKVKELVK